MSELSVEKVHWLHALMTPLITLLKHIITRTNMWLLKKSNGRLGNSFLGVPVLLLYTKGVKSGLERVTPLFYLQDQEKIILVGSNGGNIKNPAWISNINANPLCKVNVKGNVIEVKTHLADEQEYHRYWPMITTTFSTWQKFQERSGRKFPVVVLEPHRTE